MPAEKKIYIEIAEFIKDNQEKLYRFAYSYVKNQEVALDMVQDAVYKALKSYESIDSPEEIKSWVYKILVNTCLDELRKQKKCVVTAPEEMPEEHIDPLGDKAEHMSLHDALDKLDPEVRAIVVMRYFEDMKLSDIAEALEENVNSVKTKLYRGLKILKVEMKVGA